MLIHIINSNEQRTAAREQVKSMVADGLSARRIRNYLHLWAVWWVRSSEVWKYEELLK